MVAGGLVAADDRQLRKRCGAQVRYRQQVVEPLPLQMLLDADEMSSVHVGLLASIR